MLAVVVLEALKLCVPMSQVETISLGVSHMWILDKDDEELVKYVLTPMGGSVGYKAKGQLGVCIALVFSEYCPPIVISTNKTKPTTSTPTHMRHTRALVSGCSAPPLRRTTRTARPRPASGRRGLRQATEMGAARRN